MDQFPRLGVQAGRCCRHLFDQSRILLRGLVHLRDSLSHLPYACALFAAGRADLSHDVCHAPDGGDDFCHGGASLVYQRAALFHPLYAGGDEALDFLGGFGAALGQAAHFTGHHGKAAKEIKSLIQASVEQVDAGASQVRTAGATMKQVVASVQEVHHLIQEITTATTEQSGGIAQVNTAVSQLDQMTQQNASLVEESAAAAENLREQAMALSESVNRFQLA